MRPLRRFRASSPKGGALGKTANFAWTAKASPFEERLSPAGGSLSHGGRLWRSRKADRIAKGSLLEGAGARSATEGVDSYFSRKTHKKCLTALSACGRITG